MRENRVYLIPEQLFINSIKNSKNIKHALKLMGISSDKAFYYQKLKQRCLDLNINLPQKYGSSQHIIRNQITDSQIKSACNNNIGRKSTLKELCLKSNGINNKWIKEKIIKLNINISHWLGKGYLKGKKHSWNKLPIEYFLVNNRPNTNANALKKRLIKENILEHKCYNCNLIEWLEKPITVHLHHINGIRSDNRLENLILLCPNCHSQTDNFCGKNKKF